MQQRSVSERLRGRDEPLDDEHRVRENIPFGMIVRRLLDAVHLRDLGQNMRQEPRRIHELEAPARAAFGENARNLLADPLPRDARHIRRLGANRLEGFGFDLEAEARGEARRADHAQAILLKARARVADGADDAGGEVLPAADFVDHAVCDRIVHHAVDGEIAPPDVLLVVVRGLRRRQEVTEHADEARGHPECH